MISIIPATTNDYKTIQNIALQTWPIAYGEILSNEQLKYMIDKFYNEAALSELIEVKNHVFYLAQDQNEKYLGFLSYEINCEPNKTKIHKIYVLPETQGTGVGRQFFELVKLKAEENQQKAIFLNVNKYNKAQHFYTKLGFTKIKDEVIDIGNGYVMDDYVMEVEI